MSASKNHIFMDENNLIWVIWSGDQDKHDVVEVVRQVTLFMDMLSAAGREIKIITDLSKIGKPTLNARIMGAPAIAKLPYRKLALFGANPYIKHMVNLMIMATAIRGRARIFSTQKEAEAWLKKKD